MSTPTTTPAPTTPDPATTPAPKPAPPATDPTTTPAAPAQEPTDWKAEATKWEKRAKENFDKAQAHDALVESQKTEEQKRADENAALKAQVKGYEAEKQVAKWKAEVSKETGVPAAALAGSTLEDLQAHAAVLKTLITAPPRGPIVPTEGTTVGTPAVAQLNRDDLKGMTPEQINTAKAEGRLNDILGIKT